MSASTLSGQESIRSQELELQVIVDQTRGLWKRAVPACSLGHLSGWPPCSILSQSRTCFGHHAYRDRVNKLFGSHCLTTNALEAVGGKRHQEYLRPFRLQL